MSIFFLVIAVSVGIGIVGILLWSFIKGKCQENTKFITLAIIGFLLLSSPIWDKIIMKGSNWEITLYRDALQRQSEQTGQIISNLAKFVPDKKASEELKVQGKALIELQERLVRVGEVSNDQPKIEEILQNISKATAAAAVASKMAGTVTDIRIK